MSEQEISDIETSTEQEAISMETYQQRPCEYVIQRSLIR